MIKRFVVATVLIIGVGSVGTAGPTITDRNYWPHEVGPNAYQKQSPVRRKAAAPIAKPSETCTYTGGPRSNFRSCR